MVEIENKSRPSEALRIRVFRLSLAWSALHGCLMSSVSNLLKHHKYFVSPKTDIGVDLVNFLDK